MDVTHISSEGYITIPEALRVAHHWEVGQELMVIDVGNGILLKSKKSFQSTTIDQVAGCLNYQGKPKSEAELEEAIKSGVMEQWHDRG